MILKEYKKQFFFVKYNKFLEFQKSKIIESSKKLKAGERS